MVILEKVKEVIAEVLELEYDEVNMESRIVIDLGADSLDMVDLSFSLSKALNIKMPKKMVVMHAEEILGDLSSVVQNGVLTQFGAEILQNSPNVYTEEDVYKGISLEEIYEETKVRHWVNLCQMIAKENMSGDDLIQQKISSFLSNQKMVV